MNNMNTRARAKKVVDPRVNLETDTIANKYCKTIDILKKRLKEQEALNKTLLEEQETNTKEFEDLCKQVQYLKKKAFEEEEKGTELQKAILLLLNDNSKLKEEQQNWENQDLCVKTKQLETKLGKILQEKTKLELKFSKLLLQTTSSTKNGYKFLKRRIKNRKNLKLKYKRINIKINKLTSMNALMNKELIHRENTIKALQEEGDKFLDIILQNEKEIKEREITYDKVVFLEKQLNKLKNMIDENRNNDKPQNYDAPDLNKLKNMMATKKVPQTLRDDYLIPKKTNTKSVVMFSDTYGRDIAYTLNNKLPFDYALLNTCKPFINNYCKIIDDGIAKKANVENIIILIGDYDTIKHDVHGYLKKIDDTAKTVHKHKKKLIVTTIAYKSKKEVNDIIYKLNSKLFTIAALNDNIAIVELNAPRMGQSMRDFIASNIAAALLKKGGEKNLIMLTKYDDISANEKNKESANFFPIAVTPEVVR